MKEKPGVEQQPKGKKKWLIALLAAAVAALEVAGPAPLGHLLAAAMEALVAPRPSGYPDAPAPKP